MAVLAALMACFGALTAAAQTRPNIVFILTDDLDARVMRARPPVMPSVTDLIGEAGVTFSNAFVNIPLCGPSRATILTGRYAHNTRVLRNAPPDGGFPAFRASGAENSTIATWLRPAGYATALIGKYLNYYPNKLGAYIPPGWTHWVALDSGKPEATYVMNENGTLVSYDAGANDENYYTDYLARKSLEFIDAAASARKPFFLFMTPAAPHAPAEPAARHADRFARATAPPSENFNEADVSDKPPFLQVPPLGPADLDRVDELYRKRLRSLQAVDEAFLAIYRRIESLGQLDRTYFVFTSDNGYRLGNHRLRDGKETTYDEDLRVPLFVAGPGLPAGRTVTRLVTVVDLAPTIAAWADATPNGTVDGRSLVPLLGDTPPGSWRQSFPIAHWTAVDKDPSLPLQDYIGVRTARYSFAYYPAFGLEELYDMQDDPQQLDNLAATAKANLLERLSRRAELLATCAGPVCRSREDAEAP